MSAPFDARLRAEVLARNKAATLVGIPFQTTSQELKALVDSSKVKATLPTALDDKHQKMLDDLRAKNGKDFDQAYDRAQQQTHQEAVDLFQKYADGGDNADLKEWAAKTLPHLKEHLAMAEKLK